MTVIADKVSDEPGIETLAKAVLEWISKAGLIRIRAWISARLD